MRSMEELLEREIFDLKQQQALLEQELMDIDEMDDHKLGSNLMNVNTLQSCTTTDAAAVAAPTTSRVIGVAGDERIEQLEEIRRRYQREANRAMRCYYRAVSDHPRYQANREKQLRSARSFSFETRELLRSQRIRTRRMVEEQRERERELQQALHHRFKANPVPPSTYMNKYDLMVEEWRQRKAAVEALAVEKAERMKEEAEWLRISTESLRQVREVMGVRRDKEAQRARSAGYSGRDHRKVLEIHDVPLEVKMKLWPALEEHEQMRNERIKQRAADRLKDLRLEQTQCAAGLKMIQEQHQQPPLGFAFAPLQSKTSLPPPPFPPSQPQISPMPSLAVPVGGPIAAPTTPQNVAPLLVAAGVGIPVVSALGVTPVSGETSAEKPLVITPTTTLAAGDKRAIDAVQQQQEQPPLGRSDAGKVTKHNHHLTFRPKIRDGVPDFEAIWAEERLALAERKRNTKTTQVRPFSLTASPKDSIVRGRWVPSSKRAMSAVRPPHQSRNTANELRQRSHSASRHTEEAVSTTKKANKVVPKGTRAHAMRTQAVFNKFVSATEARDSMNGSQNELLALQTAYQRQKLVNARLRKYLKGLQGDTDAIINKKVRALRRQSRETEREAAERLQQMRVRVEQMPPIFLEPTHLHDIARSRAETEKEIMQMLRESGVGRGTLAAILDGATGAADDNAAAAAAAATVATTVTAPTAEVAAGGTAEEFGSKREIQALEVATNLKEGEETACSTNIPQITEVVPSIGRSSIISSSSSSSSSSNGGVGDAYDDDFEGSTSSSTVSV